MSESSPFAEFYSFPLAFLMPEKRKAIAALYTFYFEYRDVLYSDLDPGERENFQTLWRNKFDHYYLHLYAQGNEPLFHAIQKFTLPREIFDALLEKLLDPIAISKQATNKEFYQFINNTAGLYTKLLILILDTENPHFEKISFHTAMLLEEPYIRQNNLFQIHQIDRINHYKRLMDYSFKPYSFALWPLRMIATLLYENKIPSPFFVKLTSLKKSLIP